MLELQGFLQLPKVRDLFFKLQSDVHFFSGKIFDIKLTEMLALFPAFPRLDWETVHYVIIIPFKDAIILQIYGIVYTFTAGHEIINNMSKRPVLASNETVAVNQIDFITIVKEIQQLSSSTLVLPQRGTQGSACQLTL